MKGPLARFDALLGEWDVTSKKYPDGRGRTTVTPAEGDNLLRIHSELEDSRFPISTMVVGADDAGDECTVLYYDSRGVYRVYTTTLHDRVWRMWRHAPGFNQRFTGDIAGDGKTVSAQWEFSEDGKSWNVDFDLTYTKVG